jgi:hypothetical protein
MGLRATFVTATTGIELSLELAGPARATSFFPQDASVAAATAVLQASQTVQRDERRRLGLEVF